MWKGYQPEEFREHWGEHGREGRLKQSIITYMYEDAIVKSVSLYANFKDN